MNRLLEAIADFFQIAVADLPFFYAMFAVSAFVIVGVILSDVLKTWSFSEKGTLAFLAGAAWPLGLVLLAAALALFAVGVVLLGSYRLARRARRAVFPGDPIPEAKARPK